MKKLCLLVEYDGLNYGGFQRQINTETIQDVLQKAVIDFLKEDNPLTFTSRTDAKVSALEQIISFTTNSTIPLKGIVHGINSLLPKDIVIKDIIEIPKDKDIRSLVEKKTYIYKVLNSNMRSALHYGKTWRVIEKLDIALLNEACKVFIGKHDFSSFVAKNNDATSYEREIYSFDVMKKDDDLIEFRITGKSFLRHMIRIMVGTLVELGVNKIEREEFDAILNKKDRNEAGATAPGQGLTLYRTYLKEGYLFNGENLKEK